MPALVDPERWSHHWRYGWSHAAGATHLKVVPCGWRATYRFATCVSSGGLSPLQLQSSVQVRASRSRGLGLNPSSPRPASSRHTGRGVLRSRCGEETQGQGARRQTLAIARSGTLRSRRTIRDRKAAEVKEPKTSGRDRTASKGERPGRAIAIPRLSAVSDDQATSRNFLAPDAKRSAFLGTADPWERPDVPRGRLS